MRITLPTLLMAAGLSLAACGSDSDDTSDDASAIVTEEPTAVSASCVPPPDCLPVVQQFNLSVCCSETLRCGFDMSPLAEVAPMHPEIAALFDVDPDKPCWPRPKLFVPLPEYKPERIAVKGGADILVTPTCQGRVFAATPMYGCCRPDNTCAYDTHVVRSAFDSLAGKGPRPAFATPQCWTADEVNAQLAANDLGAWAYIPEASGTCDYAALNASLPPATTPGL